METEQPDPRRGDVGESNLPDEDAEQGDVERFTWSDPDRDGVERPGHIEQVDHPGAYADRDDLAGVELVAI
jgi:hypothetical protein